LELPPDLFVVVDAWPSLPEPVRAGIVAMVEASLGGVGQDLGAPGNAKMTRGARYTGGVKAARRGR
jgi:hypothetical protein